eukprot:1157712-Pelagomonas_calceolata.AAC.1
MPFALVDAHACPIKQLIVTSPSRGTALICGSFLVFSCASAFPLQSLFCVVVYVEEIWASEPCWCRGSGLFNHVCFPPLSCLLRHIGKCDMQKTLPITFYGCGN